ncbi:MAG: hypothetical protein NT145_06915 [Elusimicrobia bacterium]|nr:hypothetical protein [Elusimicrobiota bacterium]
MKKKFGIKANIDLNYQSIVGNCNYFVKLDFMQIMRNKKSLTIQGFCTIKLL